MDDPLDSFRCDRCQRLASLIPISPDLYLCDYCIGEGGATAAPAPAPASSSRPVAADHVDRMIGICGCAGMNPEECLSAGEPRRTTTLYELRPRGGGFCYWYCAGCAHPAELLSGFLDESSEDEQQQSPRDAAGLGRR
jgi:hypothetical protein